MKIKYIFGRLGFLAAAMLLLIVIPEAGQALDVSGQLDVDTTWALTDSPIQVTGDLVVAQGVTLTIDPGVRVVFAARADTTRGHYLTVNGTLVAVGAANQPITFTAQDPELPWGSLIFSDTSQDWDAAQSEGSILSYCLIEYGGNNPDAEAMIVTVNAMPRIADNAIRFSSSAGIAAYAGGSASSISGNIQIVGNLIYYNITGAVLSAEGGLVENNYFLNNGYGIVALTRSRDVEIQNNTITGSSGALFGAGIRLAFGEKDSGISAYSWTQTAGPAVTLVNADSVQPTFTAPDPGADVATLTFQLTVTGDSGEQATESVDITVVGSNQPPVASAGSISNVSLAAATVTLNGTGSADPDLGIAGYAWEQASGTTVTLDDDDTPTPSFNMPGGVSAGDEMVFTLTVTDLGGLESSDDVTIRFYDDNVYPVAVAGEAVAVVTGATVALDGSGSGDPDGGIAAYAWVQSSGTAVDLIDSDTAQPYFVAPVVSSAGETLTFTLTVTDIGGLTDSEEVEVRVNGTTAADAGDDQTVAAGDTVVLDGSGSMDRNAQSEISILSNAIQSDNDAAGLVAITELENAAYDFQFSGNNVSFSDEAGFAVYLYDWTDSSVTLEMGDNWWGTDDSTQVDALVYDQVDDMSLASVNPLPLATAAVEGAGSTLTYPPYANAGPDIEASVDVLVSLDGSNSYDPDGIATYSWQQTEGPTVTMENADSAVASFVAPSGGTDGASLRFTLTVTTGGAFSHTDEASVTIIADASPALVDAGGGCFIQSTTPSANGKDGMDLMTRFMIGALGLGLALLGVRYKVVLRGGLLLAVLLLVFMATPALAGFFAIGGGDGGDADQYNFTLETGAREISAGSLDLLVAFGMPFIPHGDDNLPDNTIAASCPNDRCVSLGNVRKGTEVGFYGKLGVQIGDSNVYINAIGGVTVYTESELWRSPGSGFTYEVDSNTNVEALYGGGVSYFMEPFDWPVLIQLDYDVTRGVTGTIGWYW